MSAVLTEVERPRPAGLFARRKSSLVASQRPAGHILAIGLLAGGDAVAFCLAAALAGLSAAPTVVYGAALGVVLLASGAYRARTNLDAISEVPARVTSAGLALLVVGVADALVPWALDGHDGLSPAIIATAALVSVLLPIGRWATYGAVRLLRRRRIVRDPIVIVGAGDLGRRLAEALDEHPEHGLDPVGFVDDIDPAGAPAPLLGGLASLDRLLASLDVRRIAVAFGGTRDRDLVPVLRESLGRSVDVYVVPRLHQLGFDTGQAPDDAVGSIPLHRLRPAARHRRAWRAKRVLDAALASAVLVVLAPLMLFLAIGVKLSSPGPVLFRQPRVGQDNRVFQLLKFRSLRLNDDSDVRWSVAGDERQTPIGMWMRRFSLDELPQLWNVVRGDMSLVGPRPERPHFVEQFSDEVDGYADRHRLPVGITGWAQVNGLRGDTSIADRADYDNHYIDDWSFRRDMSILGATVAAVVRDGREKTSA